jgi:two-component system sensor kinase FixL
MRPGERELRVRHTSEETQLLRRLSQETRSIARLRRLLAESVRPSGRVRLDAPGARRMALAILYCPCFIILHVVTNFYPLARLSASPWSPETGLTVAAAVLLGRPIILLSIISHMLADWTTTSAPFAVELPASVGYALAYAVPGTLIARWLDDFGHDSMRFLLRFITLTLAASFLFAGARAGLAVLIRNIPVRELLSPAFTLAVGDIIGILTVAPLFLFAPRDGTPLDHVRRRAPAFAIATVAIVSISLAVFGLDITDDFKFFYLLFVPVVVLAVRDGLSGAIFAVLITDASMMSIIYWREISPSTATELQLLMTSLSVTGLVLGTTVHERGLFKEALTLSQEQLNESQSLLLHSSRVAVVSEMAAALAHELNQPLSAIKVYMRALQRLFAGGKADPVKAHELFTETVAQVDHAASLIRRTRNFLRRGEKRIGKANLRSIVATSLALMEAEMRSASIHVSADLPRIVPPIWANEIQIQQVLINLLRNAKDAVMAREKSERRIILSVARDRKHPGSIRIKVADSGVGVPPDLRGELFQPFATSKEEGLGLGLALCRSIISAHGGEIWLDDSSPGMTCFVFTLRVHQPNGGDDR